MAVYRYTSVAPGFDWDSSTPGEFGFDLDLLKVDFAHHCLVCSIASLKCSFWSFKICEDENTNGRNNVSPFNRHNILGSSSSDKTLSIPRLNTCKVTLYFLDHICLSGLTHHDASFASHLTATSSHLPAVKTPWSSATDSSISLAIF